MSRGKEKGNEYEREICRSLSKWFSKGKNDDWFWRADSSGARATFRSRKGKTTQNCGDIQATCPEGYPLTKLITLECKRGYQYETLSDVFDIADGAATPTWRHFFNQVIEGQKAAGTPGWLLISQRNRRKSLCFMNWELRVRLDENGGMLYSSRPNLQFITHDSIRIFATTFQQFLLLVPPEAVIDAL